MSTPDHEAIAERITHERLGSYLTATDGDLRRALELYDWNIAISAAFYESTGRLEVVLRNALDEGLRSLQEQRGWDADWYEQEQLFPGSHGRKAMADIEAARRRAAKSGDTPEFHGKVIAELTFGFWRYLCGKSYLTSVWVPAVAERFAFHPQSEDPRAVRRDVADRVQRIHFLRNRIAHHEPIHRRNLQRDHTHLLEVISWISPETLEWVRSRSRVDKVLRDRPDI